MAEPLRKPEPAEEPDTGHLEELLKQSRAEYRTLFNACPVSIWEEDFSAARKYVDNRRAEGVKDISAYLAEHPSDVEDLVPTVRIRDINEATLGLYEAGSRDELEAGLGNVFGPETYDIFREEITALAEEQTVFTGTTINKTLTGEKMNVDLKMHVLPGYEHDWSRVLVFITKQSV